MALTYIICEEYQENCQPRYSRRRQHDVRMRRYYSIVQHYDTLHFICTELCRITIYRIAYLPLTRWMPLIVLTALDSVHLACIGLTLLSLICDSVAPDPLLLFAHVFHSCCCIAYILSLHFYSVTIITDQSSFSL